MKEAIINQAPAKSFQLINDQEVMVDGKRFHYETRKIKDNYFVLSLTGREFHIEVRELNSALKTADLRVNSKKMTVSLTDEFDSLLKKMGMERGKATETKELKAPMPGLVLSVEVSAGTAVEKDQPLLILEAMKMENVIKSPREGTIAKVNVKKGQAVEKNELLIAFE
ncbi:MAG: biotin/lipoyl-containing protein [Flavobacteriales bacterium]